MYSEAGDYHCPNGCLEWLEVEVDRREYGRWDGARVASGTLAMFERMTRLNE